ncbi:response regulator [Paenibacillus qinlingensis]|uniref:Two-component system response regulator YesN n=1 Tax=Paenibacillus qinlingensis TaxID=1837343 RepID=A0ABU1NTL2_9BACL|nr:response regulator [Paenibacillus qinlingensis]MDR6550177.1 two-component system response regulator YesN [Paenibacillus qinlingensis]
MKLLIVEDELYVRERLAEGIDWNEVHIELTSAVGTGKEAMSVLQNDHIDIVLTDIRMPEMNGLELAKMVKMQFPHIKLLILTGHDDFDYARESIEQGVFKYLIKPAENEQIVEAVLEAKEQREKELSEKHNMTLLQTRWNEHLPHLKDLFYKNWLNGRYSVWEIERRSTDLAIRLENRKALPIILDIDPIPESNERFDVKDRPLVQFSLFTIARDLLANENCVVLQDDDSLTVAIFFASTEVGDEVMQGQANGQILGLLETVKNTLKLTASAGIGTSVVDPSMLPRAYKQCRQALQERLILGNGVAIPYRDDAPAEDSWAILQELEREFEAVIEAGSQEERREEIVRRIIEEGFASGKPVSEAREVLFRIVCLLARIVHAQGWTLRGTLKHEYEDFEAFTSLLTREQIESWLNRMAGRISWAIIQRRQSSTQRTSHEVISFIQEHLHKEELSLHFAAESLFVNYSYLSRIFKESIGESFSDYVLRLRMERAKELLSKGVKVSDASEQVGYRHMNYFSKSFQKYWGVKPSEVNK